jgi:CubicO group peptidase (beta-lactamase class C family)
MSPKEPKAAATMRMSILAPAFLLLALIMCALFLWRRSSGQIGREADAYLRMQVHNSHFSGAVLVARNNRVLFEQAYGYANIEWRIPNTLDTKFRLASLTKQFTAVTIMQLQRDGKLRVEDSICQYLSPCPENWAPVTIHHLLSHTSGIHNFTDDASFTTDNKLKLSHDQIVARFRERPLQFTPGEKFSYSNSNYFLLGMIIEKVTGQSYGDVLSRRLFRPLGMRDTDVDQTQSIVAHRANGYRLGVNGELLNADYEDLSWSFGASGVYSTLDDLRKWNEALDTDTVLPQPILRRMWTAVKEDYGYGWFAPAISASTLNRRVVYHSGLEGGFVSCMSRFPQEQLLVIVLANDVMVKHACSLSTALAAIALGEPRSRWAEPVVVQLDPRVLQRYVGRYRISEDMTVLVTADGARTFGAATGLPKLEMFAESEKEFRVREFDATVEFVTDPAGRATKLLVHLPLNDDLVGERID